MENDIIYLTDLMIKKGKIKFQSEDGEFDQVLFENSVLQKVNDSIRISDFKLIAYKLLEQFVNKLEFVFTDKFVYNSQIVRAISENFLGKGNGRDYFLLEKEIWKILILKSNSEYQCSFTDYLDSIKADNKPNEIFSFIDAYSEVLPSLNLHSDTIFENAQKQLEIVKSDAQYNINQNNLLSGLLNKCKVDYSTGLALFNRSSSLTKDQEVITHAIVAGLYEGNKSLFQNQVLINLQDVWGRLEVILYGLSFVSNLEDDDCQLFIDLRSKTANDANLILARLSILFSVLRSKNIKYHDYCFKEFKTDILLESAAFYIVDCLRNIDGYDKYKTELIIEFIKMNFFIVEKHMYLVSNLFFDIDLSSFHFFILNFSEIHPYVRIAKYFHSYLYCIDNQNFEHFLVELLIDNLARRRFLGLDIFDEIIKYRKNIFSIDISQLPSIQQYKLLVSLTQHIITPSERLVVLLVLLKSQSGLIREAVICKIEELSKDYGGYILKILTEKNNVVEINQEIISRVKDYIETYYESNIGIKSKIQELNPRYTQNQILDKFSKFFSKKMSASIDKESKSKGIAAMLSSHTIQVSKGGGWRTASSKDVSPLNRIEASIVMPRSYLINPNEYEIINSHLIREDWDEKDFNDIIVFLRDEQ